MGEESSMFIKGFESKIGQLTRNSRQPCWNGNCNARVLLDLERKQTDTATHEQSERETASLVG